jgi:hypothetical protein
MRAKEKVEIKIMLLFITALEEIYRRKTKGLLTNKEADIQIVHRKQNYSK